MSAASTKLITADELLEMGDIGRCELIYGELVMMSPAGAEHGVIVVRIARYISEFVEKHGLGITLGGEAGFKIESQPDLVRAPDVAFVKKSRLRGPPPRGFMQGVPDLAVEVLSPTDRRRQVAEKVNLWLAHGTAACWVVDPATMTISVHRAGQKPSRLAGKDKLENEPTLPGFSLALSKIFRRP
jgi:Uma2 family endonuclease